MTDNSTDAALHGADPPPFKGLTQEELDTLLGEANAGYDPAAPADDPPIPADGPPAEDDKSEPALDPAVLKEDIPEVPDLIEEPEILLPLTDEDVDQHAEEPADPATYTRTQAERTQRSNRHIDYRCTNCKNEVGRSALTAKRIQFREPGVGGRIVKTRTVAWLCVACLESDPAWQSPKYAASPGMADTKIAI